jgi:hypothetical protein
LEEKEMLHLHDAVQVILVLSFANSTCNCGLL